VNWVPRIDTPILTLALVAANSGVLGAPVTYTIDPNHTHPLFEADHFNGLSLWRALFKKTTGTVTMDAAAGTGTVDVTIDMTSVDFGQDKLNDSAVNSTATPIFEAAKYPVAHYQGTLTGFVNGVPTVVLGNLTMRGVTKPVALHIDSFKCIAQHPLIKKEVCGADASGNLNRADFGITVGQQYGFKMDVTLRIQVEAVRVD
jgi:polyisoprenoid-binding protein YceI